MELHAKVLACFLRHDSSFELERNSFRHLLIRLVSRRQGVDHPIPPFRGELVERLAEAAQDAAGVVDLAAGVEWRHGGWFFAGWHGGPFSFCRRTNQCKR